MIRPTPFAAALAVSLLALTACGTNSSTDRAHSTPSTASAPGSSSTVTSPSPTQDPAAAARAEHDKAFPGIAARCTAESAAASTSRAASGEPGALPTDPEAGKYAENHAFKKQATLTPEARCRGEAHAQRIEKALTGPGGGTWATEEALESTLTAMGYPSANGEVYRAGGTLGFSYAVPGAGLCVTGRLGTPVTVEAHGAYMEGGCTEPRGGH
ncbi:hypothetical protein [Streptomyces sp. CB00455]|uniref:hypothetical protein n=1 Tax=Streptomyces sp. CB00455 TaxID=1703927 RepID=UPI000A6DF627|nr:hypothetical protein [Streptomyces sp. CB00455]